MASSDGSYINNSDIKPPFVVVAPDRVYPDPVRKTFSTKSSTLLTPTLHKIWPKNATLALYKAIKERYDVFRTSPYGYTLSPLKTS